MSGKMGRPAEDITGQKFGRLTVLAREGVNAQRAAVWRCLCDCGKEALASGPRMRNGTTQSCGCLRSELHRERIKALVPPGHNRYAVGQRFGRLTLVEPTGTTPGGRTIWRCTCDCGGSIDASIRALHEGTKVSCGCVKPSKPQTPKKPRRNAVCHVGAVFGRLTLVEHVGSRAYGVAEWRCSCECGGTKVVTSEALRRGQTKSCGCLRRGPVPKAKPEKVAKPKAEKQPKATRMSVKPERRTADGSIGAWPKTAPKRKAGPADSRPAWRPQSEYKPASAPAERAAIATVCPAPKFNHRYGVDPASVPRLFSAMKPGQYLEVAA